MQLIVLAAGRGTRLRPFTEEVPKPAVKMRGDESILGATLTNAECTFQQVIIITGYRSEVLKNEITSLDLSVELLFEKNQEYDSAGPIVSLSQAIPYMKMEDFLIVNGDTFYSADVFREIGTFDSDNLTLFVSERGLSDPDSMKVKSSSNSRVETISKDLDPGEADFVSAGALLVRGKDNRDIVIEAVGHLAHTDTNAYWHEIINRITRKHGDVSFWEIESHWWREIDTPEDLQEVRVSNVGQQETRDSPLTDVDDK